MSSSLADARALVEGTRLAWATVRDALPAEDRAIWDALWHQAGRHAGTVVGAEPATPVEGALLAMVLEHERRLRHLEQELTDRL